jgi:hypothetical protein
LRGQRLLAGCGGRDPVTELGELVLEELPHVDVVLDD